MAIDLVENSGTNATRYETLMKGFNLRFPRGISQRAKGVYVCSTEDQIKESLENALLELPLEPSSQSPDNPLGSRITVKSGGNCYEGFVSNNQNGYIIDIGLVAGLSAAVDVYYDTESDALYRGIVDTQNPAPPGHAKASYPYKALPGTQNWNAAVQLFKLTGRIVPGGSCYSVALGGHFSGGGYGLLSRLHGLTVDWLAAVDILIVENGTTVNWVHASANNKHKDLFQFCCGAGGGSIGIITAYYLHELPRAPEEVAVMMLDIPWDNFANYDPLKDEWSDKSGGQDVFDKFLNRYANYMNLHSKDSATWGLFTLLKVPHFSTKNIHLTIQYCDKNGRLDNCVPLFNFLGELFYDKTGFMKQSELESNTQVVSYKHQTVGYLGGIIPGVEATTMAKNAPKYAYVLDWLNATQTLNGIAFNQRSKYKSSYVKSKAFTPQALRAYWNYFSPSGVAAKEDRPEGVDLSQTYVQIDSYGGMINEPKASAVSSTPDPIPNRDNTLPIFQRKSTLKLQYISFWYNSDRDQVSNADAQLKATQLKLIDELEDYYLGYMERLFDAVHANETNSTPYPYKANFLPTASNLSDDYEGCYINYPDVDMVKELPVQSGSGDSITVHDNNWGVLYFGDRFEPLRETKDKYDPRNVFRHEMSIPRPGKVS